MPKAREGLRASLSDRYGSSSTEIVRIWCGRVIQSTGLPAAPAAKKTSKGWGDRPGLTEVTEGIKASGRLGIGGGKGSSHFLLLLGVRDIVERAGIDLLWWTKSVALGQVNGPVDDTPINRKKQEMLITVLEKAAERPIPLFQGEPSGCPGQRRPRPA